jgi:hypothetical protein
VPAMRATPENPAATVRAIAAAYELSIAAMTVSARIKPRPRPGDDDPSLGPYPAPSAEVQFERSGSSAAGSRAADVEEPVGIAAMVNPPLGHCRAGWLCSRVAWMRSCEASSAGANRRSQGLCGTQELLIAATPT